MIKALLHRTFYDSDYCIDKAPDNKPVESTIENVFQGTHLISPQIEQYLNYADNDSEAYSGYLESLNASLSRSVYFFIRVSFVVVHSSLEFIEFLLESSQGSMYSLSVSYTEILSMLLRGHEIFSRHRFFTQFILFQCFPD